MSLPNPVPIPFPIESIGIPETNYVKGRPRVPDMIVIHISEGSRESCINQFKNPASQVSSHFLVDLKGNVVQFVSTADTAYANGVIQNPVSELVLMRGLANPNGYSISIEHEGFSTTDITPAQYATTVKMIKFLHEKWGIPLDSTHVVRHREITASKSCPGLINVEKIIQQARIT